MKKLNKRRVKMLVGIIVGVLLLVGTCIGSIINSVDYDETEVYNEINYIKEAAISSNHLRNKTEDIVNIYDTWGHYDEYSVEKFDERYDELSSMLDVISDMDFDIIKDYCDKNEEDETNNTLVRHSDGKIWLHTGDLGYIDETGRVFYTSRLKRMIITNGYNVYPIELEEIINKCEYVKTSTVIGIPHKTKGQTPKAVIVLKDNVENTSDVRTKIKIYCKNNLAGYAVPTEYEFRDELPMTAVGKVAFRKLEDNGTKQNRNS